MSSLQIRFEGQTELADDTLIAAEVINTQLETVGKMPLLVGGVQQVDVEAGTYLVRLHLPPDVTITATTSVVKDEIKEVRLVSACIVPEDISHPIDDAALLRSRQDNWLCLWTY